MSSINGLSSAGMAGVRQTTTVTKKQATANTATPQSTTAPSKVARAVSQSIHAVDESQIRRAQVHYDLPQGHARKAMDTYMGVLHHAKKDQLAQLIGVDLYV